MAQQNTSNQLHDKLNVGCRSLRSTIAFMRIADSGWESFPRPSLEVDLVHLTLIAPGMEVKASTKIEGRCSSGGKNLYRTAYKAWPFEEKFRTWEKEIGHRFCHPLCADKTAGKREFLWTKRLDMENAQRQISGSQMKNAARSRAGLSGTTSNTELLSQVSGQTVVSEEQIMSPFSQPSLGYVDIAATSQPRRKKVGRELVDEEHLCTLVAAYNIHFEEYSAGKTHANQRIPSHVWKATYTTYLQAHPGSKFKQDSLKERLRETLKELKRGTSNEENAEKVAGQCNKVMSALRATDGHAKRNILKKRQKILEEHTIHLHDNSESSDESEPWMYSTPPMPSPVIPSAPPPTPSKNKQHEQAVMKENRGLTKAQLLHKQSNSIEKLCNAYECSTTKREALVELKLNSTCEKQKKFCISNLRTACDLGVPGPPLSVYYTYPPVINPPLRTLINFFLTIKFTLLKKN